MLFSYSLLCIHAFKIETICERRENLPEPLEWIEGRLEGTATMNFRENIIFNYGRNNKFKVYVIGDGDSSRKFVLSVNEDSLIYSKAFPLLNGARVRVLAIKNVVGNLSLDNKPSIVDVYYPLYLKKEEESYLNKLII